MKKFLIPAIASVFLIVSSCSSDDDNSSSDATPSEVSTIAASGDWRITNFTEDGDNHTNDFTGYDFTFGASNVLIADNGTNTYTGSWAVAPDSNNDDSSSDVDFVIVFSSPADFTELSEDWDVVEITSTKIVLKHISGGNGGTDFLTFQKN